MSRNSKRPLGVIFYQGTSLLDGKPIVGIATFKTSNEKTGNLIQTWILRSDVHPVEAINTGDDFAICGDCPMRGILMKAAESKYKSERKIQGQNETVNRGRACYVAVANAPRGIYVAYQNGRYPVYDATEHSRWFKRRGLRMGSYGDPVAIPLSSWGELWAVCGKQRPGYTHQWRTCDQEWSKYIMASTHSVAELDCARSAGWRSFRTRLDTDELADNEIVCPASEEGDYQETCESCGACNGGSVDKASVAIIGHGARAKLPSVKRVIAEAS